MSRFAGIAARALVRGIAGVRLAAVGQSGGQVASVLADRRNVAREHAPLGLRLDPKPFSTAFDTIQAATSAAIRDAVDDRVLSGIPAAARSIMEPR